MSLSHILIGTLSEVRYVKGILLILLAIIVVILVIGGAAAFFVAHELGLSLNDIGDKLHNKESSSGDVGSKIVSEITKSNEQQGEGSYKEVTYEDGGFRQYDTKTGELIGSSYNSDQAKLNKGDFD